MNTPNKLTILRAILVPVFLLLLYVVPIPYNYFAALTVFVIAAITDSLDGHLARKHDQITNFGKFLDPLADKVLVISAFVYFVEMGLANSVAVIIIIAREFMVTSLRLVAVSSNGRVISAGFLGKLKTVTQMISIVVILFLSWVSHLGVISSVINVVLISKILIWISAIITVISGIYYIAKNHNSVDTTK